MFVRLSAQALISKTTNMSKVHQIVSPWCLWPYVALRVEVEYVMYFWIVDSVVFAHNRPVKSDAKSVYIQYTQSDSPRCSTYLILPPIRRMLSDSRTAVVAVYDCLVFAENGFWHICLQFHIAFSALTLLVGSQEEHMACKNWVMRCWCGYPSAARCRLFAYGPADAIASQNSIISCLI